MSRRRILAIKLRHSYYVRNDLGLSGFCVYCGQTADTHDHVPPVSLAAEMSLPEFLDLNPSLLPCCRHCNSIIGNSPKLSVSSRREIVERHIEKRYPSLLKAGALLEGVNFPLTDFRAMSAYRIFKRWEFATTTFIEIPPVELEPHEPTEVSADDVLGDPNPKDCCMPFALWCYSWQISEARRIWWDSAMPEGLKEGWRILSINRHRDLVERFTGEIPEWARLRAASEVKSEDKDDCEVQGDTSQDENDADAEDEEFSRALCALVLRNAVGPDSIGFRGKKNISSIAEILNLDGDGLKWLLAAKGHRSLYTAISERVIGSIS